MSPTDVGCTTLSENKKGFVKHTNERKRKKPKRDWGFGGFGGFVEVGSEENKTTTGKERRSREGKRERGREKERGCRKQNKKRKREVLMEKISYIGWGKES